MQWKLVTLNTGGTMSIIPRGGISLLLAAGLTLLVAPAPAAAHCDTVDGPVVKAAQRALGTGEIAHVLSWVRAQDEPDIRHAFEHTLRVRSLNDEARRLADRFFFETVVRVHRQGEGAPYTGLKPAGTDHGPAVAAADAAIESGSLGEVEHLLLHAVRDGLRERYARLMALRDFHAGDVDAGREFVEAYVSYLHLVEALQDTAGGGAHDHGPGRDDHRGHDAGPHNH
jgi:hypothetical protein